MILSSFLQAVVVSSVPLFLSSILDGEKATALFRLPFSLKLGLNTQDFALTMFAVVLFSAAVNLGTLYWGNRMAIGRIPIISTRLLEIYLQRDLEWFNGQNKTDLIKRVVTDVSVIVSQVIQHLVQILAKTFDALIIFAVLLIAKPVVAVSTLLGLACIYIALVMLSKGHVKSAGQRLHILNSEKFIYAKEAVDNSLITKLIGVQDFFVDRYRQTCQQAAREQLSIAYFGILPKPLLELCLFGGVFLGVAALSAKGWNSAAIVPLLALYGAAGIRLLPAAQQLYVSLSSVFAYQHLVKDIAADLSTQTFSPAIELARHEQQGILYRFDEVYFRYRGAETEALKGINFSIRPGQKVALVGATGSGKSTLAALILGFLVPTNGRITVGSSVQESEREGFVGYVPQNVVFIDGSVAENIALGQSDDRIETSRLIEAAEKAQALEFIQGLPGGFDYRFGEDAVRLSGGQRQRIGIARALYRSPRVVVLDEASSALDARTEKAVYDPLFRDPELTVVLITHRLSAIEDCDMIVLLKDGKVSAKGSFAELRDGCEEFQDLLQAAEIDSTNEEDLVLPDSVPD